MLSLHNCRFSMNLGPGYKGDVWALGGNVYGHPRFEDGEFIHISSPVIFVREDSIVQTTSGSLYRLESFDVDKEEVFKEIEEVINRGGYSRH